MIIVKAISGPIVDELAIANLGFVDCFMKVKGKHPGEVFDSMIELGVDWEIQYHQATDEEYDRWTLADIVCRCVRAKKMGKKIILCGKTLRYEEFQKELMGFMQEHRYMPSILADNSESYLLGIPDPE
jgi:hypothetical protein